MSKIEVDAIDKQSGSTLTLGGSGTAVTLACGATQTGFGRTGTVDWNTTPKTATFTAVSGDGFFANTTGSAFNMNLPAGVAGAIVSVADYAGTWQTNPLTVVPNGTDKIGGTNASVILNTEGQSVTFIFVDSTQGWINTMDSTSNERGSSFVAATGGTITCCGNFKIHTFTGPGTFTVTNTGVCSSTVDYLVVAGGGAGATASTQPGSYGSGGGGAGGYRESSGAASGNYSVSPLGACVSALPVSVQGYPITVGGGGATQTFSGPGVPAPTSAMNGINSTFSTITAAGGGGAGTGCNAVSNLGRDGGSGGGSGGRSPGSGGGPGSGNTPPVSPPQGQNGGSGTCVSNTSAGGGGGAGAVGGTGSSCTGGPGGAGVASSISSASVTRAGGGGGGSGYPNTPARNGTPAPGGAGGGGLGNGSSPSSGGGAGTDNTGGGGGGGGSTFNNSNAKTGGNGGSGIVIIRYKFQ